MNIINLTADQITKTLGNGGKDINIICNDENGNPTQEFSIIINVTDFNGNYTFDKKISVNGSRAAGYDELGGRILWNFGPDYDGTITFKDTAIGSILAPKTFVNIEFTHNQ